jgi:hypothetical protein
MNEDDHNEEAPRGFFRRHLWWIGVVIIGGVAASFLFDSESVPAKKAESAMVRITLVTEPKFEMGL